MQSRGNGQNGPGHAAAAGEGSGPTLAALPETLQSRFAGATWQHGDAQRATYRTELSDGQLGCLKLLVDPTAQSSTRRSRLQRALEKLTQLQHPCVAQPQEIGSHAGTLWLLRHWVDGVSAGQYLRQNGALAPADAAAVVVQIADALDALHRLGLQQRDLQPAHILLSPDRSAAPRVTLIDTGLPSYGSGAGLAASGRGRAYRAPELDGERQEDFRTDLFSLGCVLYELLSAQRLFPERGPAEALERYTDPNFAVLPAGVDPDLAALVKQLVAQDPAERPLSARQVQRALRSFLPAAVAQQLTQKGLRAMHSEPPGTSSRPPRAAQRTVLGMAAGQWLHTADSAQSEPAGALSSAPPAGAGSGAPNASKRTQMFGAVTTSTPPSSHPPAAAGGSSAPAREGKATMMMPYALGSQPAPAPRKDSTETGDEDETSLHVRDIHKMEVLEERDITGARTSGHTEADSNAAAGASATDASVAAAAKHDTAGAAPRHAAGDMPPGLTGAPVAGTETEAPATMTGRLFSRRALSDPSVRLLAAGALLLFCLAGFCLTSALTATLVRSLVGP